MTGREVFVVGIFVFIFQISSAQSIDELKAKKEKNEEAIAYTNNLLKETSREKEKTLNELLLIRRKLELRQELVNDMGRELTRLGIEIDHINDTISHLENRLDLLKDEYARLIKSAYKHKDEFDWLMFLFSSRDFNQAYKRVKYLQEYMNFREKQKNAILKTRKELINKTEELKSSIEQKQDLIHEKQVESYRLSREKQEHRQLINSLKQEEQELKEELERRKAVANELEKEIERLIKAEIASKGKDETTLYKLTPEEKQLSENFSANQRKLPWPTERGVIFSSFGEHSHPVLKGITINNNGVDIATTKNARIRSVFDGVVKRIVQIPGANQAVIIRHGNFLTVYSNLINVLVGEGETVGTKQDIGIVFSETDKNNSILHFELWKENRKLNPENWLNID